MHSTGTMELWLGFAILVACVLLIDMVVLGGRRSHVVSMKESCAWTLIWFLCAIAFDIGLWFYLSHTRNESFATEKALQFLTGYLIEESLSVDNMFVFVLIFSYFVVPKQYQRRILLYGVLGAIIMRILMIWSGTWLFAQFHWLLYLFGIFLVITGIKMFFFPEKKRDIMQNRLVIFLRTHFRFTDKLHNEAFFVRLSNGLWYATPLFLVLILIEVADLIFALDSIPAIFSITLDSFIVVTSNIFAIMGLRALYFLLSHMAERFYLLKYGIAIVLVFVGSKMLMTPWYSAPIVVSLGVVVAILITTILLSLMMPPKKELQ